MIILTGILLIVLVVAPLAGAATTLRQIDRAAKIHRRPVKILLVDFFSLIFMVQIPWAILIQLNPGRDQLAPAYVVGLVFSSAMILVWWTTIASVSKAGITNVSARAQISLLVIPMTYVGSFAMTAMGFSLLDTSPENPVYGLVAIEIVLALLMIISFIVTVRAIRKADFQIYHDTKKTVADSPFDD